MIISIIKQIVARVLSGCQGTGDKQTARFADDPPHYLNWKTACRHRTKESCRCHDQMGNDFWFLPADRCLFDDGPPAVEGKP